MALLLCELQGILFSQTIYFCKVQNVTWQWHCPFVLSGSFSFYDYGILAVC